MSGWLSSKRRNRDWPYRDVQIESLNTTYSKMEGTMWLPVRAHAEMDLTKQRAQFLKETLDLLSER